MYATTPWRSIPWAVQVKWFGLELHSIGWCALSSSETSGRARKWRHSIAMHTLVDILRPTVVPYIQQHKDARLVLQQDKAWLHYSATTANFLQSNNFRMLMIGPPWALKLVRLNTYVIMFKSSGNFLLNDKESAWTEVGPDANIRLVCSILKDTMLLLTVRRSYTLLHEFPKLFLTNVISLRRRPSFRITQNLTLAFLLLLS